MIILFIIGGVFGACIVLAYPMLLVVVSIAKKKAVLARTEADEIIRSGKGPTEKINALIDSFTAIKARRIVPFLEEDQVRIQKLRDLRK